MKPLGLKQFAAVVRACEPLLPQDRDDFLRALAATLRDERELGDGVVGRAIRVLQRTAGGEDRAESYAAQRRPGDRVKGAGKWVTMSLVLRTGSREENG